MLQGRQWRYVYDRQGISRRRTTAGAGGVDTVAPGGTSRKRRWMAAGNTTGAVCNDERGNLLAVTDPLQQNTRYQYDRHGPCGADNGCARGINTSSGMKTGSLMHTDCSGSQTARFYRRTHAAFDRMTDAEPQHALRYDDSGHLTEVIRRTRTVNYQSDAAGRLVKHTSPMGRITRWQRDGRAGCAAKSDRRDGAQDGVRVRRLRASGHAHERERRTLPVPP